MRIADIRPGAMILGYWPHAQVRIEMMMYCETLWAGRDTRLGWVT
jgi:hypothetical protein